MTAPERPFYLDLAAAARRDAEADDWATQPSRVGEPGGWPTRDDRDDLDWRDWQ